MLKELSLPYIVIVHQNSKKRPKRFKHCCEIDKEIYDVMAQEEKIRLQDYIISGDVFFEDKFNTVELWFAYAYAADDFERRVHLWLLGYNPVKRKGEFF
jgi:hypothetical protein